MTSRIASVLFVMMVLVLAVGCGSGEQAKETEGAAPAAAPATPAPAPAVKPVVPVAPVAAPKKDVVKCRDIMDQKAPVNPEYKQMMQRVAPCFTSATFSVKEEFDTFDGMGAFFTEAFKTERFAKGCDFIKEIIKDSDVMIGGAEKLVVEKVRRNVPNETEGEKITFFFCLAKRAETALANVQYQPKPGMK